MGKFTVDETLFQFKSNSRDIVVLVIKLSLFIESVCILDETLNALIVIELSGVGY